MKRKVLSLCAFAVYALACADTAQTVTINGETIDARVVGISFDGDSIVLTLDDQSTRTVDMESVSISFLSNNGISEINRDADAPSGVYNLQGQRVPDCPQGLLPGIYVTNGKKILINR